MITVVLPVSDDLLIEVMNALVDVMTRVSREEFNRIWREEFLRATKAHYGYEGYPVRAADTSKGFARDAIFHFDDCREAIRFKLKHYE